MPGGILVGDAGVYDTMIRLARQHGFDVTGLDLDPAMVARAQANADRTGNGDQRRPSFLVGDVPWPWRFNLTRRIELVRDDGSPP